MLVTCQPYGPRLRGTDEAAAPVPRVWGVTSRPGGWRGPRLACLQTIYPAVILLRGNLLSRVPRQAASNQGRTPREQDLPVVGGCHGHPVPV